MVYVYKQHTIPLNSSGTKRAHYSHCFSSFHKILCSFVYSSLLCATNLAKTTKKALQLSGRTKRREEEVRRLQENAAGWLSVRWRPADVIIFFPCGSERQFPAYTPIGLQAGRPSIHSLELHKRQRGGYVNGKASEIKA